MPGDSHHQLLTRKALARLPMVEGVFGESADRLVEEYCLFPDDFYNNREAVAPYLAFIDGEPFHYLPAEALHYSCEDILACKQYENPFHRLCTEGFRFHLSRMADSIQAGEADLAARYAGGLCHVLEDNLAPPHGLEGALGGNMFVLDRLIAPPEDNPHFTPTFALTSIEPVDCPDPCPPPKLLGTSVEEAVFHLYSRFCHTTLKNRLKFVPMVQAVYSGKKEEVDILMAEVVTNAVDVIVDALFTATELGTGITAGASHLDLVSLTDVYPVCHPVIASSPYRFTPYVKDTSLDSQRKPVPLALLMPDGSTKPFMDGWGIGAHTEVRLGFALPVGVYDQFTGWAGLHPNLGAEGHVEIEWQLDGKPVWREEYEGRQPGKRFALDVAKASRIDLCVRALTAEPMADENNSVIAEPTLHRRKE